MNIFIIFTFLFISFVYGKTKEIDQNIKIQESAQFLQNQLKKDGILDLATDKSKIDKEYISGMISLSIGTIGYFTTNSDTIKLAYSGVQSLGIISIGSSINRSLYPSLDKLYLDVANMKKK